MEWEVKQYDVPVDENITERFAVWAQYQSTRVVPGKAIALTLTRDNGLPYSDGTFHTQMNHVLRDTDSKGNRVWVERFPNLRNFKLKKNHGKTVLTVTKDMRTKS